MPHRENVTTQRLIGSLQSDMKHAAEDISEIKSTLGKLPDDLIAKLDQRYPSIDRMEKVEDTIKPFASIRDKLWGWVIAAMVSGSMATSIGIDWIKGKF